VPGYWLGEPHHEVRASGIARRRTAEAFFTFLIARYRSLPLAADRAGKPPTLSSLADEKACRLAPPQHGGARSGPSDYDGGGFIARCASTSKRSASQVLGEESLDPPPGIGR
jgi:hypothetical protein